MDLQVTHEWPTVIGTETVELPQVMRDVLVKVIKKQDSVFTENTYNKKSQLMLHAYKINFSIDNIKYNYTADLPAHFKKNLKEKYIKIYWLLFGLYFCSFWYPFFWDL